MRTKFFIASVIVLGTIMFTSDAWSKNEKDGNNFSENYAAQVWAMTKDDCESFNKIAKDTSHMLCGSDVDATVAEIKLELDVLGNSALAKRNPVITSLLPEMHKRLEDFIVRPYSAESATLLSQRLSIIGMAVSLGGDDTAVSRWTTLIQRINLHTLALAQHAEGQQEMCYEQLVVEHKIRN